MWAPALSQGAPALPRRPSPPCSLSSRSSPSRRPAPSPAPFLFSFVLSSSRPRPRPRLHHFLIFSYLITWHPARYSHAIRAPVPAESAPFRTFFDDKMAVVDLLTPRSGSYKVILVPPFLLVGLIFRFVFCTTSTRYFFPISFFPSVLWTPSRISLPRGPRGPRRGRQASPPPPLPLPPLPLLPLLLPLAVPAALAAPAAFRADSRLRRRACGISSAPSVRKTRSGRTGQGRRSGETGARG